MSPGSMRLIRVAASLSADPFTATRTDLPLGGVPASSRAYKVGPAPGASSSLSPISIAILEKIPLDSQSPRMVSH